MVTGMALGAVAPVEAILETVYLAQDRVYIDRIVEIDPVDRQADEFAFQAAVRLLVGEPNEKADGLAILAQSDGGNALIPVITDRKVIRRLEIGRNDGGEVANPVQ